MRLEIRTSEKVDHETGRPSDRSALLDLNDTLYAMTVTTDDDYICEHCTRIPWLRIISQPFTHPFRPYQGSQTLGCKLCELLSQHKQQDEYPVTYLRGMRVYKNGLFGKVTCSEIEGPFIEGPFIAVSKLRPDELNRHMRDVYPEKAGVDSVMGWMKTCDSSHGTCCAPESGELLKRLKVIDCSNRTVVDAPEDCKYLALSYVWGSLSTLGPTRYTQPSSGGLLGSNALCLPKILPKTIEDSLALVVRLGYRYLWVDRYVSSERWL